MLTTNAKGNRYYISISDMLCNMLINGLILYFIFALYICAAPYRCIFNQVGTNINKQRVIDTTSRSIMKYSEIYSLQDELNSSIIANNEPNEHERRVQVCHYESIKYLAPAIEMTDNDTNTEEHSDDIGTDEDVPRQHMPTKQSEPEQPETIEQKSPKSADIMENTEENNKVQSLQLKETPTPYYIKNGAVHYTDISQVPENYIYALTSEYPKADFELEDLNYLIEVCKDYNVRPEILLAIYTAESGLYSKAANKSSTARGYGQIIKSTAKAIYENIMQRGKYTFNHDVYCTDKRNSIEMSVVLFAYLYERYGTEKLAVEYYYGATKLEARQRYSAKINGVLTEHYKTTLH